MATVKYPPCPECSWSGNGNHICDPDGQRTGNPYSYEKLLTKKVVWSVVSLLLVPLIVVFSSLFGSGFSTGSTDNEDAVDTSETGISRSLTDAETAAGYSYDDTMNFGYKFLSGKEDKKHPCYGDCVVVKVLALMDCKNVRVKGEIRKSDNADAKIYRQAQGWVGGSKSKATMRADQIKYVKVYSTKPIANGIQWWIWVNEITCTPLP